MKTTLLAALMIFLGSGSKTPTAPASKITGDYLEARTASVFAGACHFGSENLVTGRDALMAWNITSGQWKGTDLAGVKAVACVSADVNLSETDAVRHSELVIDSSATSAQASALTAAIESQYASALGKIISVRRAPVIFDRTSKDFSVQAAGFGKMSVQTLPNDDCCKMPNMVWYTPLVPVEGRKVGFTVAASYTAGTLEDPWERDNENSAFYGAFSF